MTERTGMRLVVLESPYAGDTLTNINYARAALADCLRRGEAPFASHLLYTQPGVLDDRVPMQRGMGLEAGLCWGRLADATVVYTDLGISAGMRLGIIQAEAEGRPVEYRDLPGTSHANCSKCEWVTREEGHWNRTAAIRAVDEHIAKEHRPPARSPLDPGHDRASQPRGPHTAPPPPTAPGGVSK